MAVLGWGLFTLAGRAGAMTPAPGSHADVATAFGFQPLVYSIDTLLPVVDLQQEKYWYPNLWHRRGTLVRAYLWLHIAIGWILVSLLLAALTGMIKRE